MKINYKKYVTCKYKLRTGESKIMKINYKKYVTCKYKLRTGEILGIVVCFLPFLFSIVL